MVHKLRGKILIT